MRYSFPDATVFARFREPHPENGAVNQLAETGDPFHIRTNFVLLECPPWTLADRRLTSAGHRNLQTAVTYGKILSNRGLALTIVWILNLFLLTILLILGRSIKMQGKGVSFLLVNTF